MAYGEAVRAPGWILTALGNGHGSCRRRVVGRLVVDHARPTTVPSPYATLVIDPEEAYPAQRFGAAYDGYRARVRRWI